METTKKFRIERTKKNHPAMWECGGGYSNTGEAIVIANSDGSPKKPVYIRGRGHLSCSNHALFILKEGDIIVEANYHRQDFNIYVCLVEKFEKDNNIEYAVCKIINSCTNGEWDNTDDKSYVAAVSAAVEKATCYHCRHVHFSRKNEYKVDIVAKIMSYY